MKHLQEQEHGPNWDQGTYLCTLAVLQDLSVRFFGGEEASAASVQVLKDKKEG